MTEITKKVRKGLSAKNVITIVLFVLSAILVFTSIAGFIIRTSDKTKSNLDSMRLNAVLHAASGGIVDSIAAEANAAKLKELRSRPDFRSLGMNDIKDQCAIAEKEARQSAEALYSNIEGMDNSALVTDLDALEAALSEYHALESDEREAYAKLYKDFVEGVSDWTDFTSDKDDETLKSDIITMVPSLSEAGNALLTESFLKLTKDISEAEFKKDEETLYKQFFDGLCSVVTDWTLMADITDDEVLWTELITQMPDLASGERFRDKLLADAKEQITLAQAGEAQVEAETEDIVEVETETVVNYKYFAQSEALDALDAKANEAYAVVWNSLVTIIPDLESLDKGMKNSIQESIENIAYSSNLNFTDRYNIYAAQKADKILEGSDSFKMKLSSIAGQILIGGIALLLLALLFTFWTPLTKKLGIPRTIITLFFIYLCLASELYSINVPMMLGNVLQRVGMYGVLVLAMLPGIQCGIGLNMGMTIGCISGLLATVIALQYNMTGIPALAFSCAVGALIAIPLGWAYSKLLNRMKGNEMTISTYVGFSFVSLMCIGWMLLPFNNPKIIWLLCGRGLRVTHSLLGSFAHVLDNQLAFDLFGADVPTGLLLFFFACCAIMWLFARSKTGIAMSAVGSNPRFAEASGINVNQMRTIGTVLSTMIAAVGIVIYSQAFGYAQLYTAPRQLGFIAASAILIGGATVSKAKVGHVVIGVFLFEGVLALGQQIANAAVAGGGLSEVMRIMISNGIILYALTQSGGASRD